MALGSDAVGRDGFVRPAGRACHAPAASVTTLPASHTQNAASCDTAIRPSAAANIASSGTSIQRASSGR